MSRSRHKVSGYIVYKTLVLPYTRSCLSPVISRNCTILKFVVHYVIERQWVPCTSDAYSTHVTLNSARRYGVFQIAERLFRRIYIAHLHPIFLKFTVWEWQLLHLFWAMVDHTFASNYSVTASLTYKPLYNWRWIENYDHHNIRISSTKPLSKITAYLCPLTISY